MTELILKERMLTLEDLPFLTSLGRIEDTSFLLEYSSEGSRLKTPVQVPLEDLRAVSQKGLVKYIITSLLRERPRLIPYVFQNLALQNLANYLLRYRTGSPKTLYLYVDCITRYCNYLNLTPDELVGNMKNEEGQVRHERLQEHIKALERFVAELQDEGLAPCRICNYVKAIRALYRVHGIDLKLPFPLQRRTIRKDRAPRPEELAKLLDIADLREKVIISLLALGGFREGTLIKLTYGHVKEDLERGIVPLHIHVEADITKGKYHDYDTFLGQEAVEYLKLYLETRRKGSPDGKIPPEDITDDSPLIKDANSGTPKPIGEKQIYQLVHGLYFKAGLLKPNRGRVYDLKVHSIRKFFKTQLMALGVQSDYVDYMMGHTIDTYHDIQMKGIEFLRNVYSASGLSIRPKTKVSKIEMLKTFTRGMGLDPEKILTREALAEPHRICVSAGEREAYEIQLLSRELKETLKKEILAGK